MSIENLYVGIDLGTTHCTVTYAENGKCYPFSIPQKNGDGQSISHLLFPSAIYLSDDEEDKKVGFQALDLGSKTPTRLITSAKSWLIHPSAAKQEAILPHEAIDNKRKLSALEATTYLLTCIKQAWNGAKSQGKTHLLLEELPVVITIPASFDEVARALTLRACQAAGLQKVSLIEEPLAAMYAKLYEAKTLNLPEPAQILVCDVGGGTTDFSIIQLEQGKWQRMAVGKHLLLGGDNMDQFLAHELSKTVHQELSAGQWLQLVYHARQAKQQLPKGSDICLMGQGQAVVGQSLKISYDAPKLLNKLVEGFFGLYTFEEACHLEKGSALSHMGLPYEADPSITKQLALFLKESKARPGWVLFNGGVFHQPLFQERILQNLRQWFADPSIEILKPYSLDQAVSLGAAVFAEGRMAIKCGLPRAFYLEVGKDQTSKLLTLMQRGAEPHDQFVSEQTFTLMTNQPVSFSLYHSHTRTEDRAGDWVPLDLENCYPLPPIHTWLVYGKQEEIKVRLRCELLPIGVIRLYLETLNHSHQWQLEFGLNTGEKMTEYETLDQTQLDAIKKAVQEGMAFGVNQRLIPMLEELLNQKKQTWSCGLLRAIFDALIPLAEKRGLCTDYAYRFWNTLGFCLRPGSGHPLDPYRIKELWKIILCDYKKPQPPEIASQMWICYRRIAGGLSKGQQMQLFHALEDAKASQMQAYAEKIRAMAAFERVSEKEKLHFFKKIMRKVEEGKGVESDFWALARLGARQLLQGSLADVLPKEAIESAIERLLHIPGLDHRQIEFVLSVWIAPIGNRALDVSEKTRQRLEKEQGIKPVVWNEANKDKFFADKWPVGLSI